MNKKEKEQIAQERSAGIAAVKRLQAQNTTLRAEIDRLKAELEVATKWRPIEIWMTLEDQRGAHWMPKPTQPTTEGEEG